MVVLLLLTGWKLPVYADPANDAFKKGARAERQANYDAAYTYYKEAHKRVPDNPKYLAAYTRLRFDAAAQHVHTGQLLRNMGMLAEAAAEFQRAVEIDSSSFMAQQELRRTAEMIRKQERQRLAPKAEPSGSILPAGAGESVELQPLSNAPISMHMTVNADLAYKTICKLAGLNVLIDPDYKPQKITLDLADVSLRDALDMVHLQSKTYWHPVLPNTIFVTADSPAKRKELEANVMKTFYLQNVTAPNDLQDAANTVRQMLDITRIQLLQNQDALVIRGTPDQLLLAEKLLADIDKPKSEVVINVAVMEVSRDRLRTLGTVLPTSVAYGATASSPSPSSGGSSAANSSGGFTLNAGSLANVGRFAVAIPSGASFSFLATDSNSKILQNPEIRVLNNEKATLRIGDRVPIAVGSFQPGIVGGAGVSPLVNTQFQFMDVGVNIDITPHIHSDSEVTLKMVLEISSVTGSQSIGGITEPIIGQRRIEHEARLSDGDVNLLGGILEETETQSLSGYPWVSRIPVLKYLFAQDNKERRENEIVFAITPHIIRAKDLTDDNLRVVQVGTGAVTELRRKPGSGPASSIPAQQAQTSDSKPSTPGLARRPAQGETSASRP